jgi:hypothetical protein
MLKNDIKQAMLLIATSDKAIRNSEMDIGRDELQTGAEVEARITERGKNFGENIGE